MFLTLQKFKNRVSQLDEKRYFKMSTIAPLITYKDDLDNDKVRYAIPDKLYNSADKINIGDDFEGRDKYLWAIKEVTLPTMQDGCSIAGLFDFGGGNINNTNGFEGLLYVNKKPYQAIDKNHTDVVFNDFAGEKVELVFMLWTGIGGGGKPKKIVHTFKRADIGYLHIPTNKLYYYAKAITESLEILNDDDINKTYLIDILESGLSELNWDEDKFYNSADKALLCLESKLSKYEKHSDITVNCIGHTHIDMAWLWRLKHSAEKGCRSFSTVNRLMSEYDEYKFLQTQPQLYKFIKKTSPEIYNYIKNRIKEGKWEADGGMWLEADCNISSGESLIRQLTHGIKFIKEEFGHECEYLWLPDAFGYSWALPQILKQCNIKTFMTTKISWNQYNTMPNDLFKWRGIDGSEILTYFITVPSDNDNILSRFSSYNGMINPHSVLGSYKKFRNKDIINQTLIAFGYGDGGGGATREMLEMRRVLDKLPGLPNVKICKAGEFFNRLHTAVENTDKYVSTWDGELYLEYHRGTYTSQAKNKKYNRKLEIKLAQTEWICVMSKLNGQSYDFDGIEDCWETVLCNQFHDIIPGSSIHEVYQDTDISYGKVDSNLTGIQNRAVAALIKENKNWYSAFTFNSFEAINYVYIKTDRIGMFVDENDNEIPSQRCEHGYTIALYTKPLSSSSFKFINISSKSNKVSFTYCNDGIITPFYKITWNKNGCLNSVFDKQLNREIINGLGNVLEIYEDMPCNYDAWDIDIFYTQKRETLQLVKIEQLESGSIRSVTRFTYKYNKSVIIQDMIVYALTRRIDFKTFVDWHESHRLLKAAFNVDIRATKATYDIQCGYAERPTHFNTSWDYAKFEVVAHKWMDISESDYGVSILSDCKYGYSAHDNKISITLLKSAKYPDYDADMGEHTFTYSLLPHKCNAISGDTIKEANALNIKPLILEDKSCSSNKQLFTVNSESVIIDAIKLSDDKNNIILRVHECRGSKIGMIISSDYKISRYTECNLLEQPISEAKEADKIKETLKPFSIHTYIVEFV